MTDDRRLVEAVLAGEPTAFARLVTRYERMVWHLIQRMVDRADDVPDLAQEAFLLVHRRLGQFRFEASLGTWIGQIAFSCASRHLRRRRLPVTSWDADDEGADMPIARVAAPEGEGLFDDDPALLRALASALRGLPPLQRTIVMLYHIDDLGIDAIADITRLPPGTVKSHLHRSRKRLRDHLEAHTGVGDE